MAFESNYADQEPTRAAIDQTPGPLLLEFGTAWCGYCRSLQPQLAALLAQHPEVKHIKVEDGPGRPLGRSFGVKLWPNFVFLRDGQVLRQLARPALSDVRASLQSLAGS
jgi:thioredoxin 1